MSEPGCSGTSVADALRFGRKLLTRARTETPGLDAEILLRHALQIDRTLLFTRLTEPIAHDAFERYHQLLAERARDVPIAYLTGEREFMNLSFAVGPGVLVPRPETEFLVEWAESWLCDRPTATVVDVGSGSGAIALSIAARLGPDWVGHIIAADVSSAAVGFADRNRARFGLESRVTLVQGSLLQWTSGPIDLVLANLPYLRSDQISGNPQLAAEPPLALAGGAAGLDLIQPLLKDAPRILTAGGAIGLEIDPSQREAVVRLAQRVFPESDVRVLQDLAGFDRHVTIQTSGSGPDPREGRQALVSS